MIDRSLVTQRPGESPADACRRLGWTAGTRLVGDEGYGPTVIEITAIGERQILAKRISHNGKVPDWTRENSWVLDCRVWLPVDSKDSSSSGEKLSTATKGGYPLLEEGR